MQEVGTKSQYIYAIRDKKTGKLLSRKSNSANAYYAKKGMAERKCYGDGEEVVTYLLTEIK